MEEIVLYGSGGHAKVVLESLRSENKNAIGVFDDNPAGQNFQNIQHLGSYETEKKPKAKLIITIGNNKTRKIISEKVHHEFGTTIHSSAIVSDSSSLGVGSMVLHRAVIQADAVIGKHVIINTNAIVEHDCVVSDYVHIAPGAVVCGNAQIGEGTLIGANAVVAPNVKIGNWCQISAGSSVLQEIPDFSIVKGVPGSFSKTNNELQV